MTTAGAAIVITDPQNDFLSPDGVAWELVGASVEENDVPVFVSPHYYYPTDHERQFGGTVEKLMHGIGMFDRKGQLTLEGFEHSGADWLDRFKPYLEDGSTVIASPHKVYGPQNTDLVLQLRKRGVTKVVLAGTP